MRIVLVTILVVLLFEPPPIGCSYLTPHVPETAYPESVGRFNREFVLHGGEHEIAARYSDPKRPKLHSIYLELSQDNYLDTSRGRCSDLYYASGSLGIDLIKQAKLKDASGNEIGEFRVCRGREQDADNFYVEMFHNKVTLFVRTNNLSGEIERSELLTLNDILDFAANIPFNADLDKTQFSEQL